MVPVLDLKMLQPGLIGPHVAEGGDSSEATIYLMVCRIEFSYIFFLVFLQVIMIFYVSIVALLIGTTIGVGWIASGPR